MVRTRSLRLQRCFWFLCMAEICLSHLFLSSHTSHSAELRGLAARPHLLAQCQDEVRDDVTDSGGPFMLEHGKLAPFWDICLLTRPNPPGQTPSSAAVVAHFATESLPTVLGSFQFMSSLGHSSCFFVQIGKLVDDILSVFRTWST